MKCIIIDSQVHTIQKHPFYVCLYSCLFRFYLVLCLYQSSPQNFPEISFSFCIMPFYVWLDDSIDIFLPFGPSYTSYSMFLFISHHLSTIMYVSFHFIPHSIYHVTPYLSSLVSTYLSFLHAMFLLIQLSFFILPKFCASTIFTSHLSYILFLTHILVP